MKIDRPGTLAMFRLPGPCDWCNKQCLRREPAHIFACGHGGGLRLDVTINLAALGSTGEWCCHCHSRHHSGKTPDKYDLMAVVSKREKCLQPDLEAALRLIQRLPKDPARSVIERGVEGMSRAAEGLVWRTLEEAQICQ